MSFAPRMSHAVRNSISNSLSRKRRTKGGRVVEPDRNQLTARAGIEVIIAAASAGKLEEVRLTPEEERALAIARARAASQNDQSTHFVDESTIATKVRSI